MVEDREKIESLKASMRISRMEAVNPMPFQMYRGDSALGAAPKTYLRGETKVYSWLETLRLKIRRNIWVTVAGWEGEE